MVKMENITYTYNKTKERKLTYVQILFLLALPNARKHTYTNYRPNTLTTFIATSVVLRYKKEDL